MTTSSRVKQLAARIAKLEDVCGQAYQFAGEVGAPERALDLFFAASSGKRIPRNILPIYKEECSALAKGKKRAPKTAKHDS